MEKRRKRKLTREIGMADYLGAQMRLEILEE